MHDTNRRQTHVVKSPGADIWSGRTIVVKMNGALHNSVDESCMFDELNVNWLGEPLVNTSIWYGVIDGVHFNVAVHFSREKKDSRKKNVSFVKVLVEFHPIERRKKLPLF